MVVQPIVDIEGETVHAYEALARFSTRDGNGPLHWFALADELGMRAELELACLETPSHCSTTCPRDPPHASTSRRRCWSTGAPPQRSPRPPDLSSLVVEVTEETLMRHGQAIERTLDGLRGRGVHFAVDDVGAGYSGLSQLGGCCVRPTSSSIAGSSVGSTPIRRGWRWSARSPTTRAGPTACSSPRASRPAELPKVRVAGATLVQGFLLARPGPPWPGFEPIRSGSSPLRSSAEVRLGQVAQRPGASAAPQAVRPTRRRTAPSTPSHRTSAPG